jgi:hypothetical protein
MSAILKLKTIRCSALPLAFKCPGSLVPAELPIDPHNGAADTGTATHVALQPLTEGRSVVWSRIPEIAARFGVSETEVRVLCAIGVQLWEQVKDSFPNAMTEPPIEGQVAPGITLTGHLDFVSIAPNAVRGGDWKTSRKDPDYSAQLRGYAALLLLHATHVPEATLTAFWLRTREFENYTMTRAELERWLNELRERVLDWNGVYHPGEHCEYCPRFHECRAAREYARAAVAVVTDLPRTDLSAYTPDQLITLKKKCSMVADYADRVNKALKAHVVKHGDIVGTDERITLTTQEEREIDPLLAWPVLTAAGFTDEDMAAVMSMSASKIDKRVAEKTPRGEKGRAVQAIGERLEACGALRREESKRLTIRRI